MNHEINPYPSNGEVPEGYPTIVASDASVIVVAAANSTDGKKAVADYVCDGVDDDIELNAAIAEAISTKRRVKIMEGEYLLGSPKKQYYNMNKQLVDNAACVVVNTGSYGVVIEGESPINTPIIRLSDAAYEALDSNKQVSMLAVIGDLTDSNTVWSGYAEFKNLKIRIPYNQKKVVALDLMAFGGHARVHSVVCTAYINGYVYNGTPLNITISSPPAKAVEGCIGIRFIGNGPNGSYGSELTDCTASGFYEGICINEEWAVCTHVCSIFCVYGWVFGKYSVNNITSTRVHPIVLICCGDERGVNLPRFERCHDNWQIEMIAFTIERKAANTPGGVLGSLATEASSYKGKFRGSISYTVANTQGTANVVNMGFWEYGHGHGIRTTDAAQAQAGGTDLRATFRPNYMQHYYDTDLTKLVICTDEQNKVWRDAAGNVVSNS